MKSLVSFFSLFCVSFAATAATPETVQFTGVLQQDNLTPVAIDLQLPSKDAAKLQLSSGFNLELTTPGNPASQNGARIRLVSSDGKVLHTANVSDPGLASVSFAYQICAGSVTFMSPAPSPLPACGVTAQTGR
jgi:hypothetical protein